MAAAQGAEPGAGRYRERLHPSPLLWLAPAGLAAFLGVAYAYALGPLPGVVTFAILLGLGLWVVGRTAALVEVDDEVLRAGRARLPLEFVGRVRALDEAASALARGRGGDARAYLLLRTGYARTSVAVEVTDPRDPHTYWLISTRHPDQLTSAIMGARDANSADSDESAGSVPESPGASAPDA